ncbi:MAG: xth [Bacteriovoracaceae bacterium]|nr:xth [Bacteriovoracaceae bacterium]
MIKIISWNVNGIRACSKKGFADFIAKERPQIICLQETKAVEEQCLEIIEAHSSYKQTWHSAEKPGYSGVLTWHQTNPIEVLIGSGEKKYDREGRVIVLDQGPFYLVNLYFPNGAASDDRHFFKMRFLKDILKFFKDLDKKKPVIMTGDFNIAHKPIDIHDPIRLDGTSGFKPEEREWMDQFVASGFVDTYRHLYPTAKDEYSWWSYRQGSRQRNKGWRIDYFFVSDRIKEKIKSIKMHQQVMGSDHCPLSLEVDL